ncbi:hypothetical protein GIB67_007259, partial [Kingdonia uniflora]
MVTKRVRDSPPLKLCTQWKPNSTSRERKSSVAGSMDSEETTSLSMDDEWCESLDADENKQLPEMYLPLKQSFLKAFKLMDKELKLHPLIDYLCSGATTVTLLKQAIDSPKLLSLSYLLRHFEVLDALSNKQVVDIVASSPSHTAAARDIVDSAVRAWRLKFPTSKCDDCAAIPDVECRLANSHVNEHSNTFQGCSDEIVAISYPKEDKFPKRCNSARSLAECISTRDYEE